MVKWLLLLINTKVIDHKQYTVTFFWVIKSSLFSSSKSNVLFYSEICHIMKEEKGLWIPFWHVCFACIVTPLDFCEHQILIWIGESYSSNDVCVCVCVCFRSDAGLPEVYRWSAVVLLELEELWRPGGRSGTHEVPQCHHHWSSCCGESSQQRQAESIRWEFLCSTHQHCLLCLSTYSNSKFIFCINCLSFCILNPPEFCFNG